MKYIFVAGGVMSGIGKGIATASIGRILKSKGFKVTAIKIDPYINVDAGTMNPVEHGEVFVTDDGVECDQDVGNYERFLDENIYTDNYMTTGRVYQTVISRERNLGYKGRCVEVVPDIPNEVIARIKRRIPEYVVFGSRQNAKIATSERCAFCFGKLFSGSQNDRRNENQTDPICRENSELSGNPAGYDIGKVCNRA